MILQQTNKQIQIKTASKTINIKKIINKFVQSVLGKISVVFKI